MPEWTIWTLIGLQALGNATARELHALIEYPGVRMQACPPRCSYIMRKSMSLMA